MKTYPDKKYKFNPEKPPKRISQKLRKLESLIRDLRQEGVYFMADGSLHAFVEYEDATRDQINAENGDTYRPFDQCHIQMVASGIDGGDFW